MGGKERIILGLTTIPLAIAGVVFSPACSDGEPGENMVQQDGYKLSRIADDIFLLNTSSQSGLILGLQYLDRQCDISCSGAMGNTYDATPKELIIVVKNPKCLPNLPPLPSKNQ